VKSCLTDSFISAFSRLPDHVKRNARRNYKIWQSDSSHPGLQFKKIGGKREIYSIRVGIGWRALGVKEENIIVWFWIGSHADYDKLVNKK